MTKEKKQTVLDEIRNKLKKCKKLRDEYLAGWQRERADFLNYKKENAQEVTNLIKYAHENLILEILPVLDNLERLEKSLPQNLRENEYFKGVLQIQKEFLEILKNQGAEPIRVLGERFNPIFHEVIEEVEKEDTKPQTVIEELQKGYTLDNKVIRPAKVKVVGPN